MSAQAGGARTHPPRRRTRPLRTDNARMSAQAGGAQPTRSRSSWPWAHEAPSGRCPALWPAPIASRPRMAHTVTYIPGDGTGPEIAEATRRVLEATGTEFEWDVQNAGADVMHEHGGGPPPDSVLDSIRRPPVAVKGPLTTPLGTGLPPGHRALRKKP